MAEAWWSGPSPSLPFPSQSHLFWPPAPLRELLLDFFLVIVVAIVVAVIWRKCSGSDSAQDSGVSLMA
ncbi:hypothetical protein HPG69_012684, partial [Diceros bicornis minor]